MTKEKKNIVNIRIQVPKDLHKAIKLIAVKNETTIPKVIIKSLRQVIKIEGGCIRRDNKV